MGIPAPTVKIPDHPFNQEDLGNLNAHLANINTAMNHIKLAKAAGIDVSKEEAELTASRDKFLRIKNVYFPNS